MALTAIDRQILKVRGVYRTYHNDSFPDIWAMEGRQYYYQQKEVKETNFRHCANAFLGFNYHDLRLICGGKL